MLLQGAWTTFWVCALAILIGVVLGAFLGMLRYFKIPFVSYFLGIYVSFARAVPMVTLMLFVFYGLPVLGVNLSAWQAAVLALVINTSAFNAEIWRNALQSFPREQVEAGLAVGMRRSLLLRRIMLPQMFLTSLPALINEMSFLVKASPAMAVIGMVDLTRQTDRIFAMSYERMPSIIVACVFYMVMIALLLWAQRFCERFVARLV